MFVSADCFEFSDLVEALLVVAFEELSDGEDDVDLCSATLDSECGLCHFDLQERLRSRETTADASDIKFRILEGFAGVLCHGGINADSSYVRDTREVLFEVIDRIGHELYFSDRIIGAERRVVDLMEALFPYLDVIVLCEMFRFDVSHLSLYLLIGKRAGVLRK